MHGITTRKKHWYKSLYNFIIYSRRHQQNAAIATNLDCQRSKFQRISLDIFSSLGLNSELVRPTFLRNVVQIILEHRQKWQQQLEISMNQSRQATGP